MKEKNKKRMFSRAIAIANTSTLKRAKLGAVAVCGNQVLSVGVNFKKTHPIQKKYDDAYRDLDYTGECASMYSMHAEIACLIPLGKIKNLDRSKIELYIARQKMDNDGNLIIGMSRPCPACMQYIKDFGIRSIHYTTDDGYVDEYLET